MKDNLSEKIKELKKKLKENPIFEYRDVDGELCIAWRVKDLDKTFKEVLGDLI